MRRLIVLGTIAAALVGGVAPAMAKDIVRFPLCNLEGQCDRHCVVSTDKPFFRCGYGPSQGR